MEGCELGELKGWRFSGLHRFKVLLEGSKDRKLLMGSRVGVGLPRLEYAGNVRRLKGSRVEGFQGVRVGVVGLGGFHGWSCYAGGSRYGVLL